MIRWKSPQVVELELIAQVISTAEGESEENPIKTTPHALLDLNRYRCSTMLPVSYLKPAVTIEGNVCPYRHNCTAFPALFMVLLQS